MLKCLRDYLLRSQMLSTFLNHKAFKSVVSANSVPGGQQRDTGKNRSKYTIKI